jgi:hypothetical protein
MLDPAAQKQTTAVLVALEKATILVDVHNQLGYPAGELGGICSAT